MPDTRLVQALEHNEKDVKATMPINEADTHRTYVVPKLNNVGWEDAQISEQENFTGGRIMQPDNQAFRCLQKRASPGLSSQESLVKAPISMVELFKRVEFPPLRFEFPQNHSKDCNVT
jgi:hypothetical protein